MPIATIVLIPWDRLMLSAMKPRFDIVATIPFTVTEATDVVVSEVLPVTVIRVLLS